jgi:signal transduction histidine kinase
MSKILLLLDHPPNRKLLAQWLAQRYQVVLGESDQALQDPFDVGILDGPALRRVWDAVEARKKAEEPVFLPMLLMTSRRGMDVATGYLRRAIDEVVLRPVEKAELQARVEALLRARRLSLTLEQRREDLQSFVHLMVHDLRAPVRIAEGFARELLADQATTLSEDGRSCLNRILSATSEMQQLMTALLDFGRVGRDGVRLRPTPLQEAVVSCRRALQREIREARAQVTVGEEPVIVFADPVLLKTALTNLLANSLKFVAPGVSPHVAIAASVTPDGCRLCVTDNGIGIPPEHQARIFEPFVRLHGVEEYAGFGLGLASVQKAAELMGGRVGVSSVPGEGSTFWMEFHRPEVDCEILNCR